jgi:hypothetical protein
MAVQWYTATESDVNRLVAAWEDAPVENLEVLGMILSRAKAQVIAYAPAVESEDDYPVEYAYAQLQQAINLWNAGRSSTEGVVGAEGYTFVPRPLDKTIRGLIRPIDGTPDVY